MIIYKNINLVNMKTSYNIIYLILLHIFILFIFVFQNVYFWESFLTLF